MRGKKFYLVILMFILVSVSSLFADDRRIKVKQWIRNPSAGWSELMSPQIKYSKTDKGSVYVRYDFNVIKSSTYDDIECYIIASENSIDIWSLGGENISTVEDDPTENNLPTSFTTKEGKTAIPFIISGKKGTASIEIEVDIYNYYVKEHGKYFTIDVVFYSTPRKGIGSDVEGMVKSALVIPLIYDIAKGDWKENPFGSSNRTFSFSIVE
jgi:hypothetical protein